MKVVIWITYPIALIFFSVWLFYQDDAAQPGPLRAVHEEGAMCNDCHTPWQGVSNEACLGCHEFPGISEIRQEIRFHEAELYCLKCHTEHRGIVGSISKMDHTLLNPELLCTTCHFDPHEKLFGESCRECHGLSSWDIPGYRHPAAELENCDKCHRPPLSHRDSSFWKRLEARHQINIGEHEAITPKQCWKCHVIHNWQHLSM